MSKYTRKQLGHVADLAARWWTDRLADGHGVSDAGRLYREAHPPTKDQCDLFYDVLFTRIEDTLIDKDGVLSITFGTSKTILRDSLLETGFNQDFSNFALPWMITMKITGDSIVVAGKAIFGEPVIVPEPEANLRQFAKPGNFVSAGYDSLFARLAPRVNPDREAARVYERQLANFTRLSWPGVIIDDPEDLP